MSELISSILAWPDIVQGAIGSALFSLILYFGQKITLIFKNMISEINLDRKISSLTSELVRLSTATSKDPIYRVNHVTILLLRASRPFIKALIWLGLGFIFSTLSSPFGVIGYVGFIFYLFSALEIVKPIEAQDGDQHRIEEITKILSEMKKK